jgi:3-dehydroquinate synthetase
MTTIREALTEQQQREVRMYGCTVADMSESVEESITFQLGGPVMVAMGMMSDAQETLAYQQPNAKTIEEHRQLLNRAKWTLATYVMQTK